MKRFGADYETLTLNPRLVYCSLSGFGQDGPYKSYPAHDMNYLSLAGGLGLIGDAGSKKPVIPLNLVADHAGASLHGPSASYDTSTCWSRPVRSRANTSARPSGARS